MIHNKKSSLYIIMLSVCLYTTSCKTSDKDSEGSSVIVNDSDNISYYKVVEHWKNIKTTYDENNEDDYIDNYVIDTLCKYNCIKSNEEITVDNVEKLCSIPIGYVSNLNRDSVLSRIENISQIYDDIQDPNVFSVFDIKNEYKARKIYVFLTKWTHFTFKNVEDFNAHCSKSNPIAIDIKNWLRITIKEDNAFKHRLDSTIFTPVLEKSSWEKAKGYCDSLNYQGKNWRLPSIEELQTSYNNEIYKIGSISLQSDLKSIVWSSKKGVGFLFKDNRIQQELDSNSVGSIMCVRN